MELTHQVREQLKRLRLSGVVETLEARQRQAIDGKWSYVDFLARLLEDELERRAQKQLALRVRRSSVNTTKTLEGFDFSFNPSISRQRALVKIKLPPWSTMKMPSRDCSTMRRYISGASCVAGG
jgi:DNA replication protein DnaC